MFKYLKLGYPFKGLILDVQLLFFLFLFPPPPPFFLVDTDIIIVGSVALILGYSKKKLDI